MDRREELIRRIATMMAAAYWRGRFKLLCRPDETESLFDPMIKAAAEATWEQWYSAARMAAGDSELTRS